MILYKKVPIDIQMKNIMLLDDAVSGGVVYVDRTTYDQAILLHSRFDGDTHRILKTIENPKTANYEAITGLKETIEVMMGTMPEPLNAIAPFLLYCTNNQGIEWNSNNREFAYGALHQLSQLLDFNAITLVPPEVRNMITIPTAILKQYEVAWNELTAMLDEKVVRIPTVAWEQFQDNIIGIEKRVCDVEDMLKNGVQVTQPTVMVAAPTSAVASAVQVVTQPTNTQPQTPVQEVTQNVTQQEPPKEESEEDIMAKILAKAQADADAKNAARREKEKKEAGITDDKKESKPEPVKSPEKKDSLLDDKEELERLEMNAVLDEFDV